MENTLDKIIEELKSIRTITKTKVSDEIVFEQAVKLFISKSINESKKENIKEMNINKVIGIEKPTEKQLNFLEKYGVQVMPKTKNEAKNLISKLIDEEKHDY